MGRLLSITPSDKLNTYLQKRTHTPLKIGSVSLTFITIILILLLSLLYLAFANQMSTQSYELANLEEKKANLSEEIERLEVEASRLQSIQEIEDTSKANKMVPSNKVNFTTISNSLVSK